MQIKFRYTLILIIIIVLIGLHFFLKSLFTNRKALQRTLIQPIFRDPNVVVARKNIPEKPVGSIDNEPTKTFVLLNPDFDENKKKTVKFPDEWIPDKNDDWKLRDSNGFDDFDDGDELKDESLGDQAGQPVREIFNVKTTSGAASKTSSCSMKTCFDMSRCRGDKLKVYIYPNPSDARFKPEDSPSGMSDIYVNILKAISGSAYYTERFEEACLLVLAYDTLDRDKLSRNYVHNLQQYIDRLPAELWNNGTNHLIFNMYYGTFPWYSASDIGFDVGRGSVAWASTDVSSYRSHFDIAFPLFHRELPLKTPVDELNAKRYVTDGSTKPYLLTFKGKRYVYGIGSETRNSLHHLHNDKDVIMLVTCKHGKDWEQMQDERCAADNALYDRWDYDALMANSTFCLVPRGRRLGSYRFVESLRVGCIPVVLADNWLLPFSQIIDWSRAVIIVEERMLFLVPEMLRDMPASRVQSMRATCRQLYVKYFSSVENIVHTTLLILEQRIRGHATGDQAVRRTEVLRSNLRLAATKSEYHKPTSFVLIYRILRGNSDLPLSVIKQLDELLTIGLIELIIVCANIIIRNHVESTYHRLSDKPPTTVTFIDINQLPHQNVLFITPSSVADTVVFINDEFDFQSESLLHSLSIWRVNQYRLIGRNFQRFALIGSKTEGERNPNRKPIPAAIVLLNFAVFHTYHLSTFQSWSVQHDLVDAKCADFGINLMVANQTSHPAIVVVDDLEPIDSVAESDSLNDCLARFNKRLSSTAERQPMIKLPTAVLFDRNSPDDVL